MYRNEMRRKALSRASDMIAFDSKKADDDSLAGDTQDTAVIDNTKETTDGHAIVHHEPLMRFGNGVVSFFNLVYYLIWLFILLTIVHIPLLMNYATYDALAD